MGGTQVEEARQLLNEARIPDFHMLEDAVDAFSFIGTYNRNQRLLLQTPARLSSGQASADKDGARLIIEGVLTERRKVLTEPESMAILNAFKIPAAENGVATYGQPGPGDCGNHRLSGRHEGVVDRHFA